MRKISYSRNQSFPRKTLSHGTIRNLNRFSLMKSSYTEHFKNLQSLHMLSPNISTFRSFFREIIMWTKIGNKLWILVYSSEQLKQPKCLEIEEWLKFDTFKWILIYKVTLFINSFSQQILECLLCAGYDLGTKNNTVR